MLMGWSEGAGSTFDVPEAQDDAVAAEELAEAVGAMYQVDAGAESSGAAAVAQVQSTGGMVGRPPTSFMDLLLRDWDGFNMRSVLLNPDADTTCTANARGPAWHDLGDGAKDAGGLRALLADIGSEFY